MLSLLIVFFVVAVTVSFLCSLWEAVLLSITPSFAKIKLEEGTRTGRLLESFKRDIDQPLVAILTLNTIAHTVGAIGVGQQAAMLWTDSHPAVTTFLIPLIMTLAILILSEIIPKTLGANYWEEFAPFTAVSLNLVLMVMKPLVWLGRRLTRSLKKDDVKPVFSRSDFLAMTEIGVKEGVIEQQESDLIKSLLRFKTVMVSAIMTPKSVVKMADESMSIQSFFEANQSLPFSRIPLYRPNDKDHVSGYILKDELLAELVQTQGDQPVSTLRRDLLTLHDNLPITEVFSRFVEQREHIALVVNDFGNMLGVVTMEDVIETLLGLEIVDEMDTVEDMQELARRNWQKRARRLGLVQGADE